MTGKDVINKVLDAINKVEECGKRTLEITIANCEHRYEMTIKEDCTFPCVIAKCIRCNKTKTWSPYLQEDNRRKVCHQSNTSTQSKEEVI